MLKALPLFVAGLSVVPFTAAAFAIAPVPRAAQICGAFTAGKYGVPSTAVSVRSYRTTARGEYLNWSVSRYGSSGYCFVSRAGQTTDWRVEQGPSPENVAGGGNSGSQQAKARAEQACMDKARNSGYRVYSQTAAKPAGITYIVEMEGTYRDQVRYELSCRYAVFGGATTLNRGSVVSDGNSSAAGYSSQKFMGIPNYESGLRVKNSGYEDVSPKRRNFLVKTDASSVDFRWYADCTTQDQIYDGQKYLGYSPNARSLMAYACSLPSTVRPQPR